MVVTFGKPLLGHFVCVNAKQLGTTRLRPVGSGEAGHSALRLAQDRSSLLKEVQAAFEYFVAKE